MSKILNNKKSDSWDLVIKSRSSWFNFHLTEIWYYRDLATLLVRRDLIAIYKQSLLGPLWFIMRPIFTTVVFTVVFGKIAKIPTDGLPPFLFYLAGSIVWGFFGLSLGNASDIFRKNADIFGKVYFPRIVMPIAGIITSAIQFSIQITLFCSILLYYHFNVSEIHLSKYFFLFPLLLIQMALIGLGTGIIISSLTTRYKDLAFAMEFGVQLWMYATPVVYPASQIPEKFRDVYMLNPMASILELFRYLFLGVGTITPQQILFSVVITFVLLFAGLLLFSRVEKSFMDTV